MSGPKEKQAMTKSAFIKEVHDAEAMLYHVAKSILKNDADCCDAVQETLLKAYEKLDTLKKEKFFRTRITRILINEPLYFFIISFIVRCSFQICDPQHDIFQYRSI